MEIIRLSFAALYGLVVGSFLNVCIYRLPRGESIILPGSHCPQCQTPLAWYDNLPLLGYLWLGGRCRYCNQTISKHYPLVELGNAALWCLGAALVDDPVTLLVLQFFSSALLTLSVIDLRELIIPDEINICIAALGLGSFFLLPDPLWWERLLGGIAGGGILLLLAELSLRVWRKQGIGGGDIKMMAACGLLLGSRLTLLTLFLAPFVALGGLAIAWLAGYKVSRDHPIPFGPALAVACLIASYWGEGILAIYFGVFVR